MPNDVDQDRVDVTTLNGVVIDFAAAKAAAGRMPVVQSFNVNALDWSLFFGTIAVLVVLAFIIRRAS